MQIHGNVYLQVDIKPIDVIRKLIEKEIGNGYVIEEEGKYILVQEDYTSLTKIPITKETYEYINALKVVESYL